MAYQSSDCKSKTLIKSRTPVLPRMSNTEQATVALNVLLTLFLLSVQLKNLDFEELQMRLSALDPMMEREIEELRQRYTAKRQPILDAMDAKKRRQQNF